MSSILEVIRDRIKEYERRCKKYKEKVQWSDGSPDCYGKHAKSLEKRESKGEKMKKFLLALALVFLTGSIAQAATISVQLNWKDNSNNEAGFGIEQSSTPEFTVFNQIGTTQADVATFNTGVVAPNTQYCYRVYAFNQVGNSAYSNVACVTTPSLPNGPTDLIINVTVAP